MLNVNVRNNSVQKCAFCKYWYDPTNSAISPKAPQIGIWEINEKIQKKCLLTGMMKSANVFCRNFECKL